MAVRDWDGAVFWTWVSCTSAAVTKVQSPESAAALQNARLRIEMSVGAEDLEATPLRGSFHTCARVEQSPDSKSARIDRNTHLFCSEEVN